MSPRRQLVATKLLGIILLGHSTVRHFSIFTRVSQWQVVVDVDHDHPWPFLPFHSVLQSPQPKNSEVRIESPERNSGIILQSISSSTKDNENHNPTTNDENHHHNWVVEMFNGRTDCRIFWDETTGKNATTIQWLGIGQQGHVWSAVLECNNTNLRRNITLKSMILPGHHIGASADVTPDKRWRQLYQTMVTNSSQAEIEQHFAIPIGILHLFRAPNLTNTDAASLSAFFEDDQQRGRKKRRPTSSGRQRSQGDDDNNYNNNNNNKNTIQRDKKRPYKIFSISYRAPGQKLIAAFPNGIIPSLEDRRGIVRQLVKIYYHLLERGVLYCDMKTGMQHVFYDSSNTATTTSRHSTNNNKDTGHLVVEPPGTITLIDFDNIRIINPNMIHTLHYDRYHYQRHALQLLSLLAMVCEGRIVRQHPNFTVDTSILCNDNNDDEDDVDDENNNNNKERQARRISSIHDQRSPHQNDRTLSQTRSQNKNHNHLWRLSQGHIHNLVAALDQCQFQLVDTVDGAATPTTTSSVAGRDTVSLSSVITDFIHVTVQEKRNIRHAYLKLKQFCGIGIY